VDFKLDTASPVALLVDEDHETERIASQAGFRFFTDVESFKQYVRDRVLATSLVVNL
jgi:hypothetical protein